MRPLFVYGTLKRGECNYGRYLEGRTTHEQMAMLIGAALYTEGQYPFLVVDRRLVQPTDQVCGMLMRIHPLVYGEVLRHIDELEDYTPGDPCNWYERTIQVVQTAEGAIDAWAYVAGARVLQAIMMGDLARVGGGVWEARLARSEGDGADS